MLLWSIVIHRCKRVIILVNSAGIDLIWILCLSILVVGLRFLLILVFTSIIVFFRIILDQLI